MFIFVYLWFHPFVFICVYLWSPSSVLTSGSSLSEFIRVHLWFPSSVLTSGSSLSEFIRVHLWFHFFPDLSCLSPICDILTGMPIRLLLGLSLALVLSACAVATPSLPATSEPTSTPRPSLTATSRPTDTATPSPTPTATPSPSPTVTVTPTPIPTYVTLRGKVTIEQAVCHYGPGAPYLYKYGVYQGSNLEILRRVELGNYIEVQAIGGNNPCWVRVDYMEIQGDWLDLQPVPADQVVLPRSPYYGPPTGVSAQRNGDVVTVTWYGITLRAGDDSEQTPYIVEAWVCQAGAFVFVPAGTYRNAVEIVDEAGCEQPSRARLTAAEKHGYTAFVEVPWPPAESTPAP